MSEMRPTPDPTTQRVADLHTTDVVLRCAWLREHARLLFTVDPSGQLSVHLLDFASLLEAAAERGWFDREQDA